EALTRLGAPPERVTAHLLLTGPNGDDGRVRTLRSAAAAAARQGAPLAAATRLKRALAESPPDPERAEILAELGFYEMAAMRFDAAGEHLRAAIGASTELARRAEAASILARCAIVSGGRSADVVFDTVSALAQELATVDSERSLELGSDLLMLAACAVPLRPRLNEHLRSFEAQARGHPGYEAVARIYLAVGELLAGGSAQASADEVQAALAAGLPPSDATKAGFLAVHTLRNTERYELALRLLDLGLQGARREGHAARQGLIHGQRAAIALAQGSLDDAQVEAETGLRLIDHQHFAFLQLLTVAMVVHIERGELDAASARAREAEAIGVADDRLFMDQFLPARARLRIAQGDARAGLSDLLWCGERLQALGVSWSPEWQARTVLALVAVDERVRAQEFARDQLVIARRVGAPGALGLMLRVAARAADGDQALALLEEATMVLERSSARLELAHALADLGAALNRLGRRREGRDAERRAIELADHCGAAVLAETARAELQAGPGRRARVELTGPNSLTAAERRVCHQAADGHTNREIAQALFVTEKTVERHLSSAYQKLGIRSRFQLAAAIATR
ncbi:MAG TPA: LuxR C-terminal-related transcriptional regulator, partial [Solirubrobacteraceae bacterium]